MSNLKINIPYNRQSINKKDIKIVRPSDGLEPKYISKLLGKKSKRNINEGQPILKKYY